MTGCTNSNTTLPDGTLEERLNALVPALVSLLTRITNVEPNVSHHEEHRLQLTSPMDFPDGIGEGTVVANLFRYRHQIRLDIRIDHNRVFALADGAPSDRRCFLNDYVASTTLDACAKALSTDFVRSVVAGITAARDAVRRHNKRCQAPWNEVRVAALQTAPVS
jgi:hypothetical protein